MTRKGLSDMHRLRPAAKAPGSARTHLALALALASTLAAGAARAQDPSDALIDLSHVPVVAGNLPVAAPGSDPLTFLDPPTQLAQAGPTAPGNNLSVLNVPATSVGASGQTVQATPPETIQDVSAQVYGDPSYWFLLYRNNQAQIGDFFNPAVDSAGRFTRPVVLSVPPPPLTRIQQNGGQWQIQAIPGDTFMTIALAAYGNAAYWPAVYAANKSKLPNPNQPLVLFGPGDTGVKVITLPSSQTSTPATTSAVAPPPVPPGTPPTNVEPPTGSPPPDLPPVFAPSQVDNQAAGTILGETGYLQPGESVDAGLARLQNGYTYSQGNGRLDPQTQGYLAGDNQLYQQAVSKWSGYPNISMRDTPQLLNAFMQEASAYMPDIPAQERIPLLKSVMIQETGEVQWTNYRPVIGGSGEVGIGQFMPATARGLGINPYDPRENVIGIGIFLNQLVRSKGGNIEAALASYNGGNNPPPQSWRYAQQVLSRASQLA